MATLAVQGVTRAGTIPAYAAATGGGDAFLPGSTTYLHVKNASAGSLNVTVVTPRVDALGNAIADNVVAVGAASERVIGPFPYEHYADPTTGLAGITYSGVTSLSIGAFALTIP